MHGGDLAVPNKRISLRKREWDECIVSSDCFVVLAYYYFFVISIVRLCFFVCLLRSFKRAESFGPSPKELFADDRRLL